MILFLALDIADPIQMTQACDKNSNNQEGITQGEQIEGWYVTRISEVVEMNSYIRTTGVKL